MVNKLDIFNSCISLAEGKIHQTKALVVLAKRMPSLSEKAESLHNAHKRGFLTLSEGRSLRLLRREVLDKLKVALEYDDYQMVESCFLL